MERDKQAVIGKIKSLLETMDIAIEIAEQRLRRGNLDGAKRAKDRARELAREISALIASLPDELDDGSDG